MKKGILMLVLGSFWAISCQNEPAKPTVVENKAAAPAAPVAENPAPAAPVEPPAPATKTVEQVPKTALKTAEKTTPASPKTATTSPTPTAQPAPKTAAPSQPTPQNQPVGDPINRPKPRSPLPADATCFVARETDGRVFELRLAMVDEKRVMGDLLVRNIQTGEFVQGKITGELREATKYFLTWAFDGQDKIRHIVNIAYFMEDGKLVEKSRDKEDDGRIFMKIDCGKLK